MISFNPCCGGSGSLGIWSRKQEGAGDGFQSLLWWIGLAGPRSAACPAGTIDGFNPCCGGSGSLGRSILCASSHQRRCFNPCCGGSGSLGRWPPSTAPTHRMFQSLLWWIGLAGTAQATRRADHGLVSILVVVDRARWAHAHLDRLRRGPVFQSLLWWIGLAGVTPMPPPRCIAVSILVVVDRARWAYVRRGDGDCVLGFNPCCGGSGSLGCRSITRRVADGVSILVVVDRARWASDRAAAIQLGMFQSLLWWIGLAGHRPTSIDCRVSRGFNPCCGGSGSLGSRTSRLVGRSTIAVSILVVVDRARWDAGGYGPR